MKAFYTPSDMDTLLHVLGYPDAPRSPAPESQACVNTPIDPRPTLNPVKTVTALPDGTFLVCDPSMQMVELPLLLQDAAITLAENDEGGLAKDLLLTGEE